MRIATVTICLLVIFAGSCRQPTDSHPSRDSGKMTRHDEVRKVMRSYWIHDFETADDTYWSSAAERRKVLSELRKMKKDYYYESSDPNIPTVPGPRWGIRGPLTIAQVEQESLQQIRLAPDVPQVPFGFENDKWNKLKTQYKEGDEFYFFALDPRSSASFYGIAGYVLIRDNQVDGLQVIGIS